MDLVGISCKIVTNFSNICHSDVNNFDAYHGHDGDHDNDCEWSYQIYSNLGRWAGLVRR